MNNNDGVLLVFSKAPVPGQVKKRLIPALAKNQAAELYSELTRRTLQTAGQSAFENIELHCFPDSSHPFFTGCKNITDITLHEQTGNDLGERMYYALSEALSRFDYAVVIGCDCPDLTKDILNEAGEKLQEGCSVVLGPGVDGGYYLIGGRVCEERLFVDMEWGTEAVLSETRARLKQCELDWYELPVLWDVDRPEDLVRLREMPGLQALSARAGLS